MLKRLALVLIGCVALIGAAQAEHGAPVTAGQLPSSGVAAGVYGSSTTVPVTTHDIYGRATSVTNTSIAMVPPVIVASGQTATQAIQAAATAAFSSNGKIIRIPAGYYAITSTIQFGSSMSVVCDSPETTVLDDSTLTGTNSAGDGAPAFQFGKPDGSQAASSVHIIGCRFQNFPTFNNGSSYVPGTSTSLTNGETHGESHVSIYGGQHVVIENNWFLDKPYGIVCSGCTDVLIDKQNSFTGLWDYATSGLQQSIAAIWLRSNSSYGTTQTVHIMDNYIAGGYLSPFRFVPLGQRTSTISGCKPTNASGGTTSANQPSNGDPSSNCAPWYQENVGTQYGVLVDQVEGLDVHHNYFGGQDANAVKLQPLTSINNVRISANFFDASRLATVYATSQNPGTGTSVGIDIYDNDFNGQYNGLGALQIDQVNNNSTLVPSLYGGSFHDNVVQNHYGTDAYVTGAVAFQIHHNIFSAYNVYNASPSQIDFAHDTGVFVTGQSSGVAVENNKFGGNTNSFNGTNNYMRFGAYVGNNATTIYGSAFGNINLGLSATLSGGLEASNVPQNSKWACMGGEMAKDASGYIYTCNVYNPNGTVSAWSRSAPPATF